MNTTYKTWQEAQADRPTAMIASDGHTTCLWHRQHEHYMEHVVPLLPRCPICGGVGDTRQPRHELCRLRQIHGQPIQRLDKIAKCMCSPCRRERGEIK